MLAMKAATIPSTGHSQFWFVLVFLVVVGWGGVFLLLFFVGFLLLLFASCCLYNNGLIAYNQAMH